MLLLFVVFSKLIVDKALIKKSYNLTYSVNIIDI